MLIPSNLYKYSIIFLIFLWTTVSFAEGYDTDIWCELQNTNKCGECSIITSPGQLDDILECPFSSILTINVTGHGKVTSIPAGIDCGSQCNNKFLNGTSITLSATPDVGQQFSTWEGACSGTSNPLILTISVDSGCSAIFIAVPPPPPAEGLLSSDREGSSGSGEVVSSGLSDPPPAPGGVPVADPPEQSSPGDTGTQPTGEESEPPTGNPPIQVGTPDDHKTPEIKVNSGSTTAVTPTKESEKSSVEIKPAVIQFAQDTSTVDEWGNSTTMVSVRVERTVNCQESVSVEYEIRNKTAIADEDYQVLTDQVLTWSKGDCHSKKIDIVIKNDTKVEPDETFSIALLPPSETAELGEFRTLQVTILDDDKAPERPLCDTILSLQPAKYDLLLHLDDKPLILTFANAQSDIEIKQVPTDPQVVMLKWPAIYENGVAQIEITPYGIGETTLVIGDCASQATVHITVEAIPITSCVSDDALALTLDTPTVTFLEEDRPMTLTVTGGQGRPRLAKAPSGEIVTLQSVIFPDYAAAQIVLIPRKVGETQLTIADCASEVDLTIRVLKTGTLAYYCWLDGKTTGICENLDTQQQISPNSRGIDAQGKDFTPLTHFKSENLIISLNKAKWITFVDPDHQNQKADLLAVVERQTPEGLMEWWMLDGKTWQVWNQDLATLIEMARESLPAILEKEVELGNLLSENGSFGEFTLYFGYRLENGSLIFNGVKPLYFSF